MDESKKVIALKLLHNFENDPIVVNQGEPQNFEDFDKSRINAIAKIKLLLNRFFENEISLEDFKMEIDSMSKSNPLWGFRGMSGQMFFNMLFNSANNTKDLENVLRDAIKSPENISSAKSKINILTNFIKTNSQAEDKRALPRIKSTLYFLSYFWQIQEPEKYPIFYSSLEQTFIELGFLERNDNLASFYEEFFNLNMELLNIFKQKNEKTNLWYIEHVFWKHFMEKQNLQQKEKPVIRVGKQTTEKIDSDMEFIPQVISNLVKLSLNESNPSDFEKKTGDLFKILGFEVQIAGQGKGRIVDVIARANTQHPYILLIDCKARSGRDFKLNAGEERTVIEYIKNFLHDYPRDRKLETHYLIVSSGFKDDGESVRRKIKSETSIDVSFTTAESLLFLVSKKLQMWEIDLDVIKGIFQREGLITEDMIQDLIGR